MNLDTGQTVLDALDHVAQCLRRDDDPDTSADDFEAIAGPIDRLAYALSDVGPLSSLATSDLEQKMLFSFSQRLQGIYNRVVGAVLQHVMAPATSEAGWDPANTVASHLVERAMAQGVLHVFCVNYDAVLDSAILHEAAGADVKVIDEFDGRPENRVRVPVLTSEDGVVPVPCVPWRYDYYAPATSRLRLHHLHGAGMWMRYRGSLYKCSDLSSVRDAGMFSAWAFGMEGQGGEGQVEPVVLLGDQKTRGVALWPFTETYEELATALQRADRVFLGGYSFRDIGINRRLSDMLRHNQNATVITINPDVELEAAARDALEIGGDNRLIWISDALPKGLDSAS